ncbi:STAS domain-containing protein [Micromonospora avicenniae]|uniref:STAS domain-containing protein n=1 Tax=Micromonospora avicenniae TaxID=1198245 RepID=UPI003437EE46
MRLRGEVDLFTLPMLELALELLVDTAGDVTIELDGLAFIDVLGSRALARAAARLCSGGRRLRLRGASPQIRRMLNQLGWADLFEIPLPDLSARAATDGW